MYGIDRVWVGEARESMKSCTSTHSFNSLEGKSPYAVHLFVPRLRQDFDQVTAALGPQSSQLHDCTHSAELPRLELT